MPLTQPTFINLLLSAVLTDRVVTSNPTRGSMIHFASVLFIRCLSLSNTLPWPSSTLQDQGLWLDQCLQYILCVGP